MPSMIKQVEMALLAIYRPGMKKHQLPQRERGCWYIHSGRTLENYLEWCCEWATWAQAELRIRRLVDAQLAGQPWVQAMIDQGRSPWSVTAAVSALRKLERGILTRWGQIVTLVVPEALVDRRQRLLSKRIRRGAYPLADLLAMRAYLEPEYRRAVDACIQLGLRRHEVIAVQARDVDLETSVFAVKERDGTWRTEPMPPGYAGIVRVRKGKGGRPREIPIPLAYRDRLAAQVEAAPTPETRLWPVQARALGMEVLAACRAARIHSRGVHGLRHTWAQQQYGHLRRLGCTDEAARQYVSWWLGHNRLAVTVSYIPREKPYRK